MTETQTSHSDMHHEVIDDTDLVEQLTESSRHATVDSWTEWYFDESTNDEVIHGLDGVADLVDTRNPSHSAMESLSPSEREHLDDTLDEFAEYVASSGLQGRVLITSESQMIEYRKALSSPHYSLGKAKKVIDELYFTRRDFLGSVDDMGEDALVRMAEYIHPKHLYELYVSQDESLSSSIKNFLSDDREHEFRFEQKASRYRLFDAIFSYAARNKLPMPDYSNPALGEILDEIKPAVLREIADIPEQPELQKTHEINAFNIDIVATVDKIMREHLNLPEEMVEDYLVNIKTRLKRQRDDPNLSGRMIQSDKVRSEMKRLYDIVNRYGHENIVRLHETYGFTIFSSYSEKQIDTLIKLDRSDSTTIEHLLKGDVTVVFASTLDDHNGAIVDGVSAYRKESGRSLLFEVKHLSDVYRRMGALRIRGIQPATFVYAAHGSPGVTGYGIEGGGFAAGGAEKREAQSTDEDRPIDTTVVHIRDTAFGKMVKEYMAPNRGIDSDQSLAGTKQVILHSCSGDVPAQYDTEAFRGFDSVVEAAASQTSPEDKTYLYGAEAVMYMNSQPGSVSFHHHEKGSPMHGKHTANRLHTSRMSDGSHVVRRESVTAIPVDKVEEAS